MNHTLHVYTLPDYHRDPFDRLLIAQAQTEDLPILTADPQIARYPVKVVW
ncbi:MAG: type II toxin-antitoxin system VapC family toxin [Bacillota bacterium]